MSIQAHANEIAKRMFVATADRNYILARSAFFDGLDLDFFWLSLHALEKYYKAALLMNGRTAKGFGHDVIALHTAALALEPRLPIGPLIDPGVEGLHWRDQMVESYLERLNEFGGAANRYATYGYDVHSEDLFKIDQLMWLVRRCCHPFRFAVTGQNDRPVEIDYVDMLRRDSQRWALGGHLPLEELLSPRGDAARRAAFLRLNKPFAPDADHILTGWRTSSSNPPLAEWFRLLEAPGATAETRQAAAGVLRWAVDQIQFNRNDEQEILAALARYASSKGSSTSTQ